MLVSNGPLALTVRALTLKSGLMSDLFTGRVRVPATVALAAASANGAPSNRHAPSTPSPPWPDG